MTTLLYLQALKHKRITTAPITKTKREKKKSEQHFDTAKIKRHRTRGRAAKLVQQKLMQRRTVRSEENRHRWPSPSSQFAFLFVSFDNWSAYSSSKPWCNVPTVTGDRRAGDRDSVSPSTTRGAGRQPRTYSYASYTEKEEKNKKRYHSRKETNYSTRQN